MKNKILSIVIVIVCSISLNAQIVNIPDANFKAYLLGLTCNSNADNEIQVSEAQNWPGVISCGNMNISDLTGIEAFNAIVDLYCKNNQLTTIDLSNNVALTSLNCSNNLMTSLDVSNLIELTDLDCRNNQLSYLNVANGNNTNIPDFGFWADQNPNLTCIQVDNVTYSNNTWTTNVDPQFVFNTFCTPPPCFVNIPDANFKTYLLGNTAINTNGNNEIECSEATAYTGGIYCSSLNITNLTGIEDFINIVQLHCNANQLTSIDISQNTSLTTLQCFGNQLATLDVSSNSNLQTLLCNSNQLTTMDVSNNTNLQTLNCGSNQITNINLGNLTSLWNLKVGNNPFTSLDVSNNVGVQLLSCENTGLTSLNVNTLTSLWQLVCSDNQLTSLDLSNNVLLTDLYCTDNQLTSLNLANGNNTNMNYLWVFNNPSLTCIQVDDENFSPTNWISGSIAAEDPYIYDAGANFSEDCGSLGLENTTSTVVNIYPNPANNELNIELNTFEALNVLDLKGKLMLTTEGALSHTLDITTLQSGIYFIQTSSGTTHKSIKE